MPKVTQTYRWQDENGTKAVTSTANAVEVPIGFDSDVADALQAASNAKMTDAALILEASVAGEMGAGPYDAEDRAELRFKSSLNELVIVSIPAPKTGLFLADDKTVDVTAQAVIDLVAVLMTTVCSRSGHLLETFIGGRRMRAERMKR